MHSTSPTDFLKMSDQSWRRLPTNFQQVILQLAQKQNFKCAFCDTSRNLILEHDHSPDFGDGTKANIFNTRGLACHRCNIHIEKFEADERGDYRHIEYVCRISDSSYYKYIFDYQCRVAPLIEEAEIAWMGARNYHRRWQVRRKFDDWTEWDGKKRSTYPWRWGFDEIKEKKYGRIRTPKQAAQTLIALMRFVLDEFKKNPDYKPPEQFLTLMTKVNPLFDDIRDAQPELRDLAVDS